MTLIPVTAPAAASGVVGLELAKTHLRVDGAAEDALITGYVGAAVAMLDGAAGRLGRALLPQQWTLVLDAFPASSTQAIRLPLPPLRQIDEVAYVDGDGVRRVWAAETYQVVGGRATPARLFPAYGQGWPVARAQPGAVEITFTAGYDAVPEPIVQAVLLLVGQWYANREAVNVGNIVNELPFAVEALLTPYSVPSLA